MSRIILGVTGSVAAVRTPALFAALRASGHEARIVATEPALHFFDPSELGPNDAHGGPLFRDADEWPPARWQRDDPVPHIEFRRWADLLILAPLDANTLGKVALGLCDNFLTCPGCKGNWRRLSSLTRGFLTASHGFTLMRRCRWAYLNTVLSATQ